MEPVFYKDGKLSICSNSQVHRVSVDEGEFKHLQSERAKGKHVRCITCDHTTIITDGTTINGESQVVSINNEQRVAENGASDSVQGRDGAKATAVLYLDDKRVIVGFEDGQIFQDGIFVAKCPAKVTGLCMTAEGSVLVADLTGSVSKIGKSLEKVFQIPVDERENQNLRAYRLISIQSPDHIQIILASGDNGTLFVINQDNEMIKVGDNPHHMPIIQILVDQINPNQFITVGYDRVIAHWEVLPGGNYLEMLGCLHTLGSTVSHLQVSNQTLYIPQPHKLLVMNLENSVSFDCQLPQSQLLELKVTLIDGLLLLRYQTRIVLFMTHTRETVLSFKTQNVVDAIFTSTLPGQQSYKYVGLSKETYSLLQDTNFTILALQETQPQGFAILQLCQNNQHKTISQGQQQMKRIISPNCQYSDSLVLLLQNSIEIKGKYLAITSEVLLVATKSTLQFYSLQTPLQSLKSYKLSFSIVQSCMIPDKAMCAIITEDGHLRLFDLLAQSGQFQCLCNTKLKFGFKQRVTAMTATSTEIVFATDDKCIVSYSIGELIQSSLQQATVSVVSNKETKNKRLNQTTSADSEYPLFGIVRSRVFFQQKLSDTQRVTAMLQSNEINEKIDLKLLRWKESSEENKQDAILVIQMELNSCTRVERFEFYQKMVVLEYWLSLVEGREYNREMFDQHKSNFGQEAFVTKFDQLLEGKVQDGSLHLEVIQMLAQQKIQEAIMIYSEQNYLTEAICLSKAFGDRAIFKQVLTQGEGRFSEAKDRQAQALKLQAALKQL